MLPDRAFCTEGVPTSCRAHHSPWAFDRDHRKQQDFDEAGLIYRRFTALQVLDEPERVLAAIVRAMAEAAPLTRRLAA